MMLSKRPNADIDEFQKYVDKVVSNLEKMEADISLYINNEEAVLEWKFFDECQLLLEAFDAVCLIKAQKIQKQILDFKTTISEQSLDPSKEIGMMLKFSKA